MSRASNDELLGSRETKQALLALGGLVALAWLAPAVPALLYAGRWPALSPVQAIVGTVRVFSGGHFGDPASAYPAVARVGMPAAAGWWASWAWFVGFLATAGATAWKSADKIRARTKLGRRAYDPRGSRPRDWARPRDLDALVVGGRRRDRFTIGRLDRRLLASDDESHPAVIAPTRAGKSTRCVIPWLLEHDGPAIVTSTKTDVLEATGARRTELGEVWVWDPFGERSAGWTPLAGCEAWSYALRQGRWLADAAADHDSGAARFWQAEGAKLLAPLLHAAELAHRPMADVVRWVDTQDAEDPDGILRRAGSHAARDQLAGVTGLDPRNKGTTYMSAGSLLAAYRYPEVQASDRPDLTPARLLDGGAHTLYIVSASRYQELLAPLVVAMLSQVFHAAAVRAGAGRPLSPTLRVLVDEAANIAPLRDLPRHLSEAAGYGVRIATIWQSVAQIRERYGHDAANTILASSTAKLFMGPVTDDATRDYLGDLLGDEPVAQRSITTANAGESTTESVTYRPKANAAALQQLDRAVYVQGTLPPAVVRLTPYWEERELAAWATLESGQAA